MWRELTREEGPDEETQLIAEGFRKQKATRVPRLACRTAYPKFALFWHTANIAEMCGAAKRERFRTVQL